MVLTPLIVAGCSAVAGVLLGLLAYPMVRVRRRIRGRRRAPTGAEWSIAHGAEAPAARRGGPADWMLLRGGPVLLQIGDRRVLAANGQVVRVEGREDVKVAAALEEQVVWLLSVDAATGRPRRGIRRLRLPWRTARRGATTTPPPDRPRVDRTA